MEEGYANLVLKERGPRDQRSIEGRPDVLVFSTRILAEPLEVTGMIKAVLQVKSNVYDTDFAVKLTDVYPDGRSILICDGIRRAALRESYEKLISIDSLEIDTDEKDLPEIHLDLTISSYIVQSNI